MWHFHPQAQGNGGSVLQALPYARGAELGLDAGDTFAFVTNDYHIFRAGRIAGTDAACGVAATLPRSAYYDALQLNYYVREAFATGWLLLRGN